MTADQLATLFAGGVPASVCLLEAGYGLRAPFEQAHIPGAAYLDTDDIEHAPRWLKAPDHELLTVLLSHGIRHDTTVILYGRNNLAAARAAQLMLYMGVADVRLLDGGFDAWLRAGHACACGAGLAPAWTLTPAADFGRAVPAHPEYIIDTVQARALLARTDGALASIRSEAEHLGKISGYSYISQRGDIPGARWVAAGEDGDIHSMSAYQLPNGAMKPASEIEQLWQAAGITRERQVAFYCGTGWRASMAFFYAYLMGWPRISVYDGGWCAWAAGGEA
ncbi:sulfurtransferase [Duganella sp. BuS-21]|uniref:sulfurtransferase n=1 Tax=Duganella sp. BuS-21 TaxID=2943848 RepID=UPI0035A722E2